MVPDVRRPDISAADERMVPAPVHHHGGNLPGKPLIPIGDDHESKTKYITGIVLSVLVICALTFPAFALTESDVQSQVSASGKEGVAGNLFVWFLCAVAF